MKIPDSIEMMEKIRGLLGQTKTFNLMEANTLIIGLGGTGIGYAAEIRKQLSARYTSDILAGYVDFLFIDNDTKEFSKKRGITLNVDGIQLSAAGVLAYKNGIPGRVTPWYNAKVKADTLLTATGAGGFRMIGRTLLLENTGKLEGVLLPLLEKYSKSAEKRQTNIIIIAGISGGLGSGTFIDMPYFIRELINVHYPQAFGNTLSILGMFELPDSTAEGIIRNSGDHQISPEDRWRLYSNGYAALKELNFFMIPYEEGEDAVRNMPYAAYFGEKLVTSQEQVYKQVMLFSRITSKDGVLSYKDPDDPAKSEYLQGALPEIINLMISTPVYSNAQDIGEDNETNTMRGQSDFASVLVNTPSRLYAREQMFYLTMGAAKLEIPLDKILISIIARIFIGLKEKWAVVPTEEDVIAFRNVIYVAAEGEDLDAALDRGLRYVIRRLSENDLTSDDVAEKIKSKFNTWVGENITDTYFQDEFIRQTEKLCDTYGPSYVMFMLNGSVNGKNIGICHHIKTEIEDMTIPGVGDFSKEQGAYKGKIIPLGKEKVKDALTRALRRSCEGYKTARKKDILEGRLLTASDRNNRIYTPITALIETFSGVLGGTIHYSTEIRRNNTDKGEVFSWDFSDVPWDDVNARVAEMFVKVVKHNDNKEGEEITGKLWKLDEKGLRDQSPISFRAYNELVPIRIEAEGRNPSRISDVYSITEVLKIGGMRIGEFDFDDVSKNLFTKFLNAKENDSAYDLLEQVIMKVVEKVKSLSFAALLLMAREKAGNWAETDLTQLMNDDSKTGKNTRTGYYKETLVNFSKNIRYSFPLSYNAQDNAEAGLKKFAFMCIPAIDDEAFENALKDLGIATSGKRLNLRSRNLMLDATIYFKFGLSLYGFINECKKAYEERKAGQFYNGTRAPEFTPGLHLAEGPGEHMDWRNLPDIGTR
jgi:hypothetical protein